MITEDERRQIADVLRAIETERDDAECRAHADRMYVEFIDAAKSARMAFVAAELPVPPRLARVFEERGHA